MCPISIQSGNQPKAQTFKIFWSDYSNMVGNVMAYSPVDSSHSLCSCELEKIKNSSSTCILDRGLWLKAVFRSDQVSVIGQTIKCSRKSNLKILKTKSFGVLKH